MVQQNRSFFGLGRQVSDPSCKLLMKLLSPGFKFVTPRFNGEFVGGIFRKMANRRPPVVFT